MENVFVGAALDDGCTAWLLVEGVRAERVRETVVVGGCVVDGLVVSNHVRVVLTGL